MRKQGIGSSEIAAIVGLNPWEGPMDIYMRKLGLVDEVEENEAMWLGKEMEAVIDKRYTKATTLFPQPIAPIIDSADSWRRGSPDRVVYGFGDKIIKLLEYKTTGSKDGWGDPGTDQVPDYVACQVQWLLGLLPGVQEADVPVYFMGRRREFCIYHLNRDQEVINSLVEAGRNFWFNHVLPQVPPPIDGSAGASEYLKRVYPRDVQDIIAAPPMADVLVGRIIEDKKSLAEIEADIKESENRLKAMIGNAAGLLGQGWKATWKKSKDREVINWEKAFEMAISMWCRENETHYYQALFDGIVQQHTTIKPGTRRFLVTEIKNGN